MYIMENEDFLDLLLDEKYSYKAQITNQFNTTITINKNGVEARKKNWNNYLKRYRISYDVKSDEDVKKLRDFFNTTYGSYYGFKFLDFTDFEERLGDCGYFYTFGNFFKLTRPISLDGDRKNYRTIDAFQDGLITLEDFANNVVKNIDHRTGKFYLTPSKVISFTNYNDKTKTITLPKTQDGYSVFDFSVKYRKVYVKRSENTPDLVFDIISSDRESLTITIIDFDDRTQLIKQSRELAMYYTKEELDNLAQRTQKANSKVFKFYHIVRFEDDTFTITLDDYNINSATVNLVELRVN